MFLLQDAINGKGKTAYKRDPYIVCSRNIFTPKPISTIPPNTSNFLLNLLPIFRPSQHPIMETRNMVKPIIITGTRTGISSKPKLTPTISESMLVASDNPNIIILLCRFILVCSSLPQNTSNNILPPIKASSPKAIQ